MTPERAAELAKMFCNNLHLYPPVDTKVIQQAILAACKEDKSPCKTRLTIYEAGEHEAWVDYSAGLPRILIRRVE